jgi:hypothetical protein
LLHAVVAALDLLTLSKLKETKIVDLWMEGDAAEVELSFVSLDDFISLSAGLVDLLDIEARQ